MSMKIDWVDGGPDDPRGMTIACMEPQSSTAVAPGEN